MAWNIISAFVLDQLFGYQSANRFRENLIAIASAHSGRALGGSRDMPNHPVMDMVTGVFRSKNPGVGPFDALNFIDVEIDGTNQGGVTFRAKVEVRVGMFGQSITPKIRNITTGADAGVGVACTTSDPAYAGTNQKQTIVMTLATGVNKYRLQYTLGRPSGDTWATGEIESFVTA